MLKIRLCLIKKQHQCWLTIAASSLAWNFLQMDGSLSVLIGIIKFVLLWFPRIHWMGLTRDKLFAWVILNMYPALTSFVPQIIHMGFLFQEAVIPLFAFGM
ncbi:uncharacterized protein LOC130136679 isoform X3 [Syzygium oleosum]|uniref:uncharacterized protein LOC130136679 isoform X3 n=1 Tax=Syzygium oleosum TaxID=219896 RepID=UPI0024B8F922|nr:uncharacterized protein LOC130136679 isoform X3 [Syzygium oleosum]